MRKISIPMLLALLLGGCNLTIIDHGPQHEALTTAIQDTAAELNLHYALLDNAAGLDQARAELVRHGRTMADRESQLRATMTGMDCARHGHDTMMSLAAAIEARVSTYLADTAAAASVAEMRALCRAYGDDMDTLLARVGDRADELDCTTR